MKEIKFRAFHKDFGMCYECEPLYEKREFYPFGICVGFSHYSTNNWEIMQYTGVKDKNNKEIYEGDIVKLSNLDDAETWTEYENNMIGKVKFTETGINLFDTSDDWMRFWYDGMYEIGASKLCFEEHAEIIGNIYENLELLC